MSRNTKIVLGAVAGVLVLCMLVSAAGIVGLVAFSNRVYGSQVGRVVAVEEARAEPVLSERAEMKYAMPAGWSRDLTIHILGFEMNGLRSSDDRSHIYLLQLPPDGDIEASVQEALDRAGGDRTTYRNGMRFVRVGETEATLRGQRIVMTISEGTNRRGETYRQLTGVAHDETGQVVVVIEQPVVGWDQAMVDSFMASVQ